MMDTGDAFLSDIALKDAVVNRTYHSVNGELKLREQSLYL